MAKKAENGKITKIEKPYGGSTVKERKAAMSRGLTEEELKARNIIPETNPAGEPHRIIAEELYSENDTFVPYKPDEPILLRMSPLRKACCVKARRSPTALA